MKILFVYPDIGIRGSAKHFSAGIGYLAAVLKAKGHETGLIYWCGESVDKIKKRVKAFSPGIIAFSSMTTQFKHIIRLCQRLRRELDAFFICGGAHVTLVPEALKEAPLNAICRGEGEDAIIELVEKLTEGGEIKAIRNLSVKDSDRIYQNPMRPVIADLDSLPFPDREVFDYQSIIDSDFGQASFIFSRGCPFNCSYCSNHAFRNLYGEPYVRFRSIDNALAEIENVSSRYNFKNIVFDDDTMTVNKIWLRDFFEAYRKSFNYPFDLNVRVETADSEIFSLLKEAGCRKVSIGIECGNQRLRTDVLRRQMTDRQILECFSTAKNIGLKTKSFNLIGFPGENKETFMDTIRINRIVNPSSLILNIFYPYPGTDLYNLCREKGYIGGERRDFRERDGTILNLPDFPAKEIIKLYRRFGYLVYLNTSLWKALIYLFRYSPFGEPFLRWVERNMNLGGRYVKKMIKTFSRA